MNTRSALSLDSRKKSLSLDLPAEVVEAGGVLLDGWLARGAHVHSPTQLRQTVGVDGEVTGAGAHEQGAPVPPPALHTRWKCRPSGLCGSHRVISRFVWNSRDLNFVCSGFPGNGNCQVLQLIREFMPSDDTLLVIPHALLKLSLVKDNRSTYTTFQETRREPLVEPKVYTWMRLTQNNTIQILAAKN